MSKGMPKLGYSNLYWTKEIARRNKKTIVLKENLEEPTEIPMESLEEKILSNVDREQVKILSDKICPNDLTSTENKVIL